MEQLNRPLLKKYLPQDPVIIEAGANIGRDSLKLHKLFPQATIYSFEPVPALFEQLKKAVAGIEQIKIFNVALSNSTGITTMHVSAELGAVSSLLEPSTLKKEKPNLSFEKIKVPTITLDDWAAQHGIKKVDFLWLDLQGHELAALKASTTILKNVHAIYTEATLEQRYEGQVLYPELKKWLEAHDFQLVAQHFHHTTWGNVLFVKKTQ